MSTVHLVFGPQGAGKTTHARALAARIGGVRFSIDEWMAQLFAPDWPLLSWPRGVALVMLDALPPLKRAFTNAMLFGLR